jgi:SAM-dependent methyltransferase
MITSELQARAEQIFTRCAAGAIPPNVALMQLLIACEAAEDAAALIDIAIAAKENGPLREMRRLRDTHRQAWSTIHAILADIPHDGPARAVRDWAVKFDGAAAVSPEAGVALYSLGSPDELAAATDEIIARLRCWQLLASDRRILDLGCGIGRLAPGLTAECALVVGAEISLGMLKVARARCAALPGIGFFLFGGEDLSPIADRSFDLILAVDSFPYIVQSGFPLVRRFFNEMARSLAPGGDIVIFNFSYRGDLARDRDDIGALAEKAGLTVRRNGTNDLMKWDGTTFHLSKPARSVEPKRP